MIGLLLELAACAAGVFAGWRYLALPTPLLLRERRSCAAAVRAGGPYAYRYVMTGPATLRVVRCDRLGPLVITRTAPCSRDGRRAGRSRLVLR